MELAASELYDSSVPVELSFENASKDLTEIEVLKSEAQFPDILGSSSPRVSSSFTPKHDYDISLTDTGDSSSRTSLTISMEKMVSEDSVTSEGTSSRALMSLMEADAYSYHTSSGTMDKVCAFCSRGEKSLLGQGDLTRYEPTPGFNPFKKQLSRSKRSASDLEETIGKRGLQHLTWRRSKGTTKLNSGEKNKTVISQSQTHAVEGNPLPTTVDELSLVGYSEDIDVAQVFEKTGHISAHHCCAAWSEGVIQSEDYSLRFVDKAVFSGLAQKCSYCCRYGATIKCRDSHCYKKYHYPCASGGGCFQDIKTLSLLCTDHTDQAVAIANQEACCVVCDTPGSISDQLFCTSCGQHYHGNCLDPTVEVNPVVRAGWQCPECKICQTCRQPGDDNKMLVCDTCDKGYHTFCLRPVMTTIPKNGWKCKNCRVCGDCGSRTPGSGPSSRWHLNYSVCDSCYQQRNKGLCCPLCGKAYRQFTQNKMVPCCLCKRYVHAECDDSVDLSKIEQEDYVCLACKNRDATGFEIGSQTDSLSSMVDDASLQDIENFSIFKGLKAENDLVPSRGTAFEGDDLIPSSHGLVLTEDSISSSDIDLNALTKEVQQLDTPSTIVQSNSMSEINNGSDVSLPSASKLVSAGSSNGSTALRPAGPGIGKPMFDEQYEKKLNTSRSKNRSVAIGKKKRMTSHTPADRKRGPKPKLKQLSSFQAGTSVDQASKEDDHSSTIVLCSAKDQFTLKQDMCLSCGSYGKGEEGRLIACVQCGQCYHPYCVNLKVSVAMLQKGWRCLDCTVCEGCGKPHDESRLILCDECDISYHIYCLDPPLDSVPQGSWKCKWCILCTSCGANTPGIGCQWRENYSQCGPCASLEICPFCNIGYVEGDLIIQCTYCNRWLHALCDGMKNEEDTEAAVDYGYNCMFCRPKTGILGPLLPRSPDKPESIPSRTSTPPPLPALPAPAAKEPEPPKIPKTFFLDGVCLSEAGIALIRNKSLKLVEKKRPRWKRTPTAPAHAGLVPMLSISSEKSEEDADLDSKGLATDTMDGKEFKVETPHDDWEMVSPTYDKQMDSSLALGAEKKKKAKSRMGLGIGGFLPRHRARGASIMRSRIGSGFSKSQITGDPGLHHQQQLTGVAAAELCREDDESRLDSDSKKPKRRTRKPVKKSQFEDTYPVYLQEAFFGRFLLDKCKANGPDDFERVSDDGKEDFVHLSNLATSKDSQKSRDPFEFSDSPPVPEALTGGYRSEGQCSDSAWIIQQQQQHQPQSQQQPAVAPAKSIVSSTLSADQIPLQPQQHEEDFDKDHNIDDALDVLPSEPLEVEALIEDCWEDITAQSDHSAMLTTSIDELAQIDNETLEDILKNGLANDQQPGNSPTSSVEGRFSLASLPVTNLQDPNQGSYMAKNSLHRDTDIFGHQDTPSSSISPFSPSLGPDDFSGLEFTDPHTWPSGSQFPPHQLQQSMASSSSSSSSHMMQSMNADDLEGNENLSYNQRNVKKWRKDEPLGEMATISPVLYANICHPELKTMYTEWNERAKHISKLWRKVPTEQRAPYLARARENRASSRLQKQPKGTQETKRKQKEATPSSSTGASGSLPGLPPPPPPLPPPPPPLPPPPETPEQVSQDRTESAKQDAVLPQLQPFADESDDKALSETDPYAFMTHTPSTQSSPSGNYAVQHASAIFKQPHPPSLSYDHCVQLTPGTTRSGAELLLSHHHPHQAAGGSTDPYSRPPTTPSASPNELSPSRFVRLPGTGRPSPGSGHSQSSTSIRPSPAQEVYGPRMFASPFPPPSPRLPDPYGYGDAVLRGGPDRFPVPGAVQSHPPDKFAAGQAHSLDIDLQASKTQKHSDGHKSVPPVLQRSISDPFGQPLIPRQDPYSHSPMTPRPMSSSDPYGHAPVTPRPNMSETYGQPPLTPKPIADHYAQPPLIPKPSIPDPYCQTPKTPRPNFDGFGQPSLAPRPNPDLYGQPVAPQRTSSDAYAQPPVTPRPNPELYGQPPITLRLNADTYGQTLMTSRPNPEPYTQPPATPRAKLDHYGQVPVIARPNSDPYGQPPMTPRPHLDHYNQPSPMSRPGVNNLEQFGPLQMSSRSLVTDAIHRPLTPRASTSDAFGGMPSSLGSHKAAVALDQYGHPTVTSRHAGPDAGYGGQMGMPSRPSFSESRMLPRPTFPSEPYGQPRTARPGVGAVDMFSQPPSTPQMISRPMSSDDYSTGGIGVGTGLASTVSSQSISTESFLPPRTSTSEPYRQLSAGLDQYSPQQQEQQQQPSVVSRPSAPPDSSAGEIQQNIKASRHNFITEDSETAHSSLLEGDQQKQDAQRHQLRELLAKQSKQRQKQKKQEEQHKRIQQEQQAAASIAPPSGSLRNWPEDNLNMPFPNVTGFSQYEGLQRPDMIGTPNVDLRSPLEMERWPKEQMIRLPHPGQIRPHSELDQFALRGSQEEMMQQRFSIAMRGIRPTLAPNMPYTSLPYQQQQQPMQLDIFPSQLHSGQTLERFRHSSSSVPGEMTAGQKPQPVLSHRSTGALQGQEGMTLGFQQVRMMHPGPVAPVMTRLPGGNPYETMIRGQGVSRITTLPQHMKMINHWPSHMRHMAPYGMRSAYPELSSGVSSSSGMQQAQVNQALSGSSLVPPGQSFGMHLQAVPHLSIMPQAPQGNTTLGPGPHESDKSNDQFEDILGTADDGFNLLEYADPDLDSTLTEQHDKSIFDEHLGITSKGNLNVPTKEAVPLVVAVTQSQELVDKTVLEPAEVEAAATQIPCSNVAKADATASEESESKSAAQNTNMSIGVENTTILMEEKNSGMEAAGAEVVAVMVSTKISPDLSNFQAKFIEYSKRQPAESMQSLEIDARNSETEKDKRESSGMETTCDGSQLAASVLASTMSAVEQEAGVLSSKQDSSLDEPANDNDTSLTLPMQVDGCGDYSSADEAENYDEGPSACRSNSIYVPSLTEVELLRKHTDFNLIVNIEEPELVGIWASASSLVQVDGTADNEEDVSKNESNQAPVKNVGETAASEIVMQGQRAETSESKEKLEEERRQILPVEPSINFTPDEMKIEEESSQKWSHSELRTEQISAATVSAPSKSPTACPSTVYDGPTSSAAESVNAASTVTDATTNSTVSQPPAEVVAQPPAEVVALSSVQHTDGSNDCCIMNKSETLNQIAPATSIAAGFHNQEAIHTHSDEIHQSRTGAVGNYSQQLMMSAALPSSGMTKQLQQQQQLMNISSDQRLRGPLSAPASSHQVFPFDMMQQQQQQYLYHHQQPVSQSHLYSMHMETVSKGLTSVQRFTGSPSGLPPPYTNQQQMTFSSVPLHRIRQPYVHQAPPRLGYLSFQGLDPGYNTGYSPSGQVPHSVMHQIRSPHLAQSPHSLHSPIGFGVSGHQEVVQQQQIDAVHPGCNVHPRVSPRPAPSPVAWTGSISGQSPQGGALPTQQPLTSPRTLGTSPHMTSPHQRSHSGTPQMSPAGMQQLPLNTSQPSTPQANICNTSASSLQLNSSSGQITPGSPVTNISTTLPFLSCLSSAGGTVTYSLSSGSSESTPSGNLQMSADALPPPVSQPDDQLVVGPAVNTNTQDTDQGFLQLADGAAQLPHSTAHLSAIFMTQSGGQMPVHQQQQRPTVPSALSTDLSNLQSAHPVVSPVMYLPRGVPMAGGGRGGSFLPRDPLASNLAQSPFQRPHLPGYQAGVRIFQHMMPQGGGSQPPILSGLRTDSSASSSVTATTHSAIGALLNQQRPICQPPGNEVLQQQQQQGPLHVGPHGPRAYYHLTSGQTCTAVQRTYLQGATHMQVMNQPVLGNVSGPQALPTQVTVHATQPPHLMSSLSLPLPVTRPGLLNQSSLPSQSAQAIGHSSQSSGMPDVLVGQRSIPFSQHPYSAVQRGLAAAGQQQTIMSGLHVTDLQHSAVIGLTEIPQQGLPSRPKRLEEQPLLLEDLLEQEKQEQQRQAEQQSLQSQTGQDIPHSVPISNAVSTTGTVALGSTASPAKDASAMLTDADLDKLAAPVDVMLEGFHRSLSVTDTFPSHPQQQQIEQTLQQTSDHGWMSVGIGDSSAHLFSARQMSQQLGPGMAAFMVPPQQVAASSGMCGPTMAYPVLQIQSHPPPPRPPEPPAECHSEEDQQVKMKYEEWLMQFEIWITSQIQVLEQQVVRYRKTKKALNAKLRVARKNSSNLSETDQHTLTITTQEQSNLQKQLDQMRKQHRTHKNLVAEYRAKQPEFIPGPWPPMPSHPPDAGVGFNVQSPLMATRKSPSSSVPVASGSSPQLPIPRMPGVTPLRLPPEARQQYDAYVQDRLRMQQARPPRAVIVQGDENNPFSESYQQREHLEKLRQQEQQRHQMQCHADQQQHRPIQPVEQSGIETSVGMAYVDHGQVLHQKQFLQFPQDGASRLSVPRFPGDQTNQPRFGHPGHVNFPTDLPLRLFSPASGSESNLSAAGPSGHSSPGLSPAPSHATPGLLTGGPFSPQVKSENTVRKVSIGSASAALHQMQQGLNTSQHAGGMGLHACSKSDAAIFLPNITPHILPTSLPNRSANDQQIKAHSQLPFVQSPTGTHFALQSHTVVSRSSQHLTLQTSQTALTFNETSPGNLEVPLSGSMVSLPEQPESLPLSLPSQQSDCASSLDEKPKKKRRRRKKPEAAAAEDAEPGCTGSDLDLNPHVFMPYLPTELTLGSPSGNRSVGMPKYGIRPECPPKFTLATGDIVPRKMVSHIMDMQQQQCLQIATSTGHFTHPRLHTSGGPTGLPVAGMSDLQNLVSRVQLQAPQQHCMASELSIREPLMAIDVTGGINQLRTVISQSSSQMGQDSCVTDSLLSKQQQQICHGFPGGHDFKCSAAEHGDATQNDECNGKLTNQNVLIKKLLKPSADVQIDPTCTPNRLSEDEETIQLTPEQQLQLELIERMPYMIEKSDQDDGDPKSGEEKDKINELKRQEFERRRKAMAELQPKGVKSRPRVKLVKQECVEGERISKKRKKPSFSGNIDPMVALIQQQTQHPQSSKVTDKVDYDAISDQLMHQIHQLPPITLQEPEVKINYAVWPMLGTSLFSDGSSSTTELQGGFGAAYIDAFMDYYNMPPFIGASRSASAINHLSKPPGSGVGTAVGGIGVRSPCVATEFIPVHQRLGIDTSGLYTRAADPTSTLDSNNSMSLVSSILNEQQSRPSMADHLKFPSPPLIEPQFEALSRTSDQSPLTIISSSSPELMLDENSSSVNNKYPGLRLISVEKRNDNCSSPIMPVVCPVPFKAVTKNDSRFLHTDKLEKDKENVNKDLENLNRKEIQAFLPSKRKQEQNQVSVMLTLSPNAAENIGGVIAAIADLLRIAVPPSYEISRSPSPSSDSYWSSFSSRAKHKEEAVNIQSLMKSKQKLCHNCDAIVLCSGVMKKNQNDLGESEEIVFCDVNCLTQFEETSQFSALNDFIAGSKSQQQSDPSTSIVQEQASLNEKVEMKTKQECDIKVQDKRMEVELESSSISISCTEVLEQTFQDQARIHTSSCSSPQTTMQCRGLEENKLKHKAEDDACKIVLKKAKEPQCMRWNPRVTKPNIINAPTEKELNEVMDKMLITIRPKTRLEDTRKCVLCHEIGDANSDGAGRLLIMDADKWIHLNCALWSYEVYETMNGALVNVDQAYKRGLPLECVICHKMGATISCFRQRCTNIYHVQCAQLDGAMFFEDKTVLCSLHSPKADINNVLSSIAVFRRVYVNRDENKQIARVIHLEERKCVLRIGGLIIHSLGQLLPHQIHSGFFNTLDSIYPVGFKSTRYYWSYRQINKRCRYVCKIEDQNGKPEFIVTVLERGMEQVVLRDSSCKDVWEQALQALEKMRRENDLVKIFPTYLSGEDLFGLTEPAVLRIIESLPGVEMMSGYNFRYGKSSIYKLPLAVNPSGSARTEPKPRTHFKKPHTLHGSSNARSLPSTVTVMPGDVNSPYLKQFVHSKSQQYRRLKTEWRNNVYLRRSNIQGLGLFAARELEKHTMVIEYIGQLIRSEVAEKREKLYEKTNHGVYMFRIDDNCVVDATMSGGPARYVNHSCNPNCVAEVVPFEKDSKIIIITKRKISQGEELCYDYKFDFEDDQHKIPCLCGAANCRKWMN